MLMETRRQGGGARRGGGAAAARLQQWRDDVALAPQVWRLQVLAHIRSFTTTPGHSDPAEIAGVELVLYPQSNDAQRYNFGGERNQPGGEAARPI